jgi:hypothetical protein
VDIMGGQAQGRVFDPDVDIPPGWPEDHAFYKGGSGWQGFALYDVAADEYVRWGFPTFNNDGKVRDGREVWETVTIPAEELATLANDGKDYRLDIFDSFSGGWGWIGFDTVRVPDAEVPYAWTRDGDDNLWTNPANWDNGVPTGNEVHVNGPAAGAPNGPVIEDGMEAVAGILISDGGTATMTMTGGTLELTDWGMWWGDAEGANATFFMSGGTIDYTGSPGIMEMAWQPDDAPVGSSVGIWNMTGGEINAKGIDIPGDGEDGNPGRAEINLDGGVINVGTERGGLMMYEGAVVNITEGQFLLEGDQEEQVQTYIDNGWITAYGSNPNAELVLGYDATQNLTFLSAIIESLTDCNSDGSINVQDANCTPLDQLDDFLASLDPPSLRGDADGDGEVQFTDFVILSNNFGNPGDYTSGDFDKDGVVQFSDFVILSSNFGQTGGAAALASVPEPSGLLWFGLGGLLTGLVRRRRRV